MGLVSSGVRAAAYLANEEMHAPFFNTSAARGRLVVQSINGGFRQRIWSEDVGAELQREANIGGEGA